MDIENGYYLEKFQDKRDFEKVISQGPWVTYGQYLIVQPWIKNFNMFKLSRSFQVPLFDLMSSMVKLIFSQLATKYGENDSKEVENSLINSCSHRVEVIGYSSGIWLGWKDLIWVDLV
ncbi:hypothetical protein Goshw_021855 [Gossypium schwendimanii]|uniref:DUF4283 domain-containing protein n=1 Tax=Gossypium schwendimanii TaxID=34291 RepID=A0A7J9N5Z3_GOSSC|nr:hypothetical protein [Gossypium schwendimanii]